MIGSGQGYTGSTFWDAYNFIVQIKKNLPQIILTGAFALTILAHGIPTPVGFLTITTVALSLGIVYTFKTRLDLGRPVIPVVLLSIPVVMATLIYFSIGLLSVTATEEPLFWAKEVLQRTLIIWLPLLVFSLTPRKPSDLKFAILSYLPICALIAVVSVWDARHSGFAKPVYALGMHKNHIAGSCSVMSTIAIAAMITSRDVKRRLIMAGFLIAGIVGCVASQGKAGLCCIIVATIFMLIAAGAQPRKIIYFVLSVVCVGALLWNVMPKEAIEHVVSNKKFSTNEIRMSLWTDVLPVLVAEPFTAVGWGNILMKGDRYYGDCANVLLFDWFQLTIFGPIALIGVIFFAVKLPLDNARRMPKTSLLAFINLVALGVICGRFTHAMVDTFWIGRGVTLVTFAAVGMAVFVKLYLDQTSRGSLGSAVQQRPDPRLSYGPAVR
jgi:hypothetical protein